MSPAPRGPLRAALIDLDGTLMHTAPDLALAANRVRSEFGLPGLDEERISQFVGKGTDMLVHRALTDDIHGRVGDEVFQRARATFESHYRAVVGTQSRVFERVPEALAELRDAGLLVGCVTNKPREFTLALLEGAHLLALLEVVVAGNDVARRKPHPDLILEACARLRVAPAETILIGDSANDAQAAHAAGCSCVLVETGYNEGESVHARSGSPGVDAIFPSLFDAARWVLQSVPPPVRG
ncbi:MAG TPA: phosphoglycolate phosphatase [Burkholderiaceae bacterium]|nr:phosphoglycolate phosphatase [Burkholderiaceae bacterium]